MAAKGDLRVTKTIRAIKEVFLKLICLKPVNRITVTELAGMAEMNKGTFYHHYADIYALYDEVLEKTVADMVGKYNPYPYFFTDPEAFVRDFLFTPFEPPTKEEVALLKEENLRFASKYPALFVDAFRKRIYAVGKLAPCRENDAKLEYILNGTLALLIKPHLLGSGTLSADPFVIQLLAGSIRQLFPEFHSA